MKWYLKWILQITDLLQSFVRSLNAAFRMQPELSQIVPRLHFILQERTIWTEISFSCHFLLHIILRQWMMGSEKENIKSSLYDEERDSFRTESSVMKGSLR